MGCTESRLNAKDRGQSWGRLCASSAHRAATTSTKNDWEKGPPGDIVKKISEVLESGSVHITRAARGELRTVPAEEATRGRLERLCLSSIAATSAPGGPQSLALDYRVTRMRTAVHYIRSYLDIFSRDEPLRKARKRYP
jgi:hypothetical protein